PGPPFPTLPDYVRAELRSIAATAPIRTKIVRPPADDDEDEDDRDLPMMSPSGSANNIPRNAFGRAEDEITNDFAMPSFERTRPRASEPPSDPVSHSIAPAT